MVKALIKYYFFFFIFSANAADLPDLKMTPGSINIRVTQQNIQTTICVKGYTKTIRPPTYFTNSLKKKQILSYGYIDLDPKHYEEDHLIPLSIGGSPDAPSNLWPQPRTSEWNAAKKDALEFRVYKLVCEGELSLEQAQKELSTNWIEAYKRYIGPKL